MPERTKYTPGTFSWIDLTTTDQDAAKTFYTSLFGWDTEEMPTGENSTYTMAFLQGKAVAAIAPQPQQQADAGAPPVWNSYVTVESADDTLERVKHLGGNVHAPAFDVFDAGRMGVIQDPQGAFLLAWEPKERIGASLVNAPGALAWNELATPDMDGSSAFYGELFGWTFEPMEESPTPYSIINTRDGHSNGGIRQASEQEPTYWLAYIGADDVAATVAKAGELGGTTLMEPMEIGPGKIAAVQDPQGAVFALFEGDFDE